MKKLLTTLVLCTAAAVAQQPAAPTAPPAGQSGQQQPTPDAQQPAQPGQAQGQPAPGQQPQQKTIKNPAEYNAYVAAVGTQDPNGKIAALEAFITQYPQTVVMEEALDQLQAAYLQTGNVDKAWATGERLLQVAPNNVRALTVMAHIARSRAEAGQNPDQNAQAALQYGQRGLQALQTMPKPPDQSDADFQKLKNQLGLVLHGAAGRGALQAKDFKAAQEHFRAAVQVNPNNLNDVYPLAISYLQQEPPDVIGLWYIAKAVNLAQQTAPAAVKGITDYGRAAYRKYHGGDDGWNELVASVASQPAPPPNFSVKPAPTPEEQAAKMVAETPIKEMSFAHFAFILPIGGAPADQVWSQIEGKPIAFQGRVVEANRTTLRLAATQDSIDEKRYDVELQMKDAIPAALMPKVGQDIPVQGAPVSFTPKPFVMQMNDGMLIKRGGAKPAAKTPAKKPTTRRRRPS